MKKELPTTPEEFLNAIETEAARTIEMYGALIQQCRCLAKAMNYQDDWVIGKVMPKSKADRTNIDRIRTWFDKEKSESVNLWRAQEEWRKMDRRREELLESLNLTADEMALLGIES